ncbi:alpha-mannosidase [Psychromarinibacter halotolerans]|uniref:Alpha-mannosidase n=1 Tax=Psychromarinibacter halotolerans TaxID=1775175 RepID=A0ABV7GV49_9RHOB|nr:alpha-mannosidase [Psychromarinibacter halotolerans]MDF0595149.1 glycoside hydrolase family 38 C-terminal domain-containing protein [Psychromarinibacter halotolerans]
MSADDPRFDRIYMVGHAHLDPVWLWRWTEGYQEARATLHAAVKLLAENPDYVFTFEQMAVVDWIRESDPALFAQLQDLVAAGRIAMVGGWWVEPDCNLPSLEAFVRHGLLGQRYLLEHFGGIAGVGLNADPFGHSVVLPQILQGHRIDGYCFLRPGPEETEMPHTVFEWEGFGDARVLAYRIPHQYCSTAEAVDEHLNAAVDGIAPSVTGEAMVFYGVGNHGGGPTRRNLESIARIDASGAQGQLTMSGPDRYLKSVRDGGVEVPGWTGELQRHAAGCYAAHSGIKAMNVRAEAALVEAERYATLAARRGAMTYPGSALTDAWKTLLFNQFHDILPGSSLRVCYEDAAQQIGGAMDVADRVVNLAMQTTARDISIPEDETTQPVLVFNPHPHPVEVTAEVEVSFLPGEWALTDEEGNPVEWQRIRADATLREADIFRDRLRGRIAFRAALPALGHKLYRLRQVPARPEVAPDGVRAQGLTLENAHLRVTIDPDTGWLSELVTLADGQNFAPPAGARHTVVSEDTSDTWGHRVETYVGPGQAFEVEEVVLVDKGPVRATVKVISRLGASTLTEFFVLDAGATSLEIRCELDWHEKMSVLKLRYPSAIQSESALYQMQHGALERPADAKEYPGQRWVSVADGDRRLTVLNDAKYAYDCAGGDIGITAARSPVYAWHDPRELREGEHYHYQDQGRQHFTVRLLPQSGGDMAGAHRLADLMTAPPRVMMESFHDGPLAAEGSGISGLDDAPAIRLTAIKAWEDDTEATVLRFANDTDAPASADLTLHFLGGQTLAVALNPLEIGTWVVPASGAPFRVDLLEFPPDHPLPRLSDGV